jgi:hypothetical protein
VPGYGYGGKFMKSYSPVCFFLIQLLPGFPWIYIFI